MTGKYRKSNSILFYSTDMSFVQENRQLMLHLNILVPDVYTEVQHLTVSDILGRFEPWDNQEVYSKVYTYVMFPREKTTHQVYTCCKTPVLILIKKKMNTKFFVHSKNSKH